MLDMHYRCLQALKRCTFYPGSFDKRFVRDVSSLGEYDLLTIKQIEQVERLAFRYRKQLSKHGYHPPVELMEAYVGRVRAERAAKHTPDEVKYYWAPEQRPQPVKENPQLPLELR